MPHSPRPTTQAHTGDHSVVRRSRKEIMELAQTFAKSCQVPQAFTPWGAFYQYIRIRRMCGRFEHKRLVSSIATAFHQTCDTQDSTPVPGNGERRSHEIAVLFGHESQLLCGLLEYSHTRSTQSFTTGPHALRETLELAALPTLHDFHQLSASKRARLSILYRNISLYFDCAHREGWQNYNKWAASLGNELTTHNRRIIFRVTYIYPDKPAGAQNRIIELAIDLSPGTRQCSINDIRIQYRINKGLKRLEEKTMSGRFRINELLAVGELIRESLPHEAPQP